MQDQAHAELQISGELSSQTCKADVDKPRNGAVPGYQSVVAAFAVGGDQSPVLQAVVSIAVKVALAFREGDLCCIR